MKKITEFALAIVWQLLLVLIGMVLSGMFLAWLGRLYPYEK